MDGLAFIAEQADVIADYNPELFVKVFAIIFVASGIGLGLQGWFAPGTSMVVETGNFEKRRPDFSYEEATEQSPNVIAWGARNIGMVIPLFMALVLNNKNVYIMAWLTQIFRDVPDTLSGIYKDGINAMYVAFGFLAWVDIFCLYLVSTSDYVVPVDSSYSPGPFIQVHSVIFIVSGIGLGLQAWLRPSGSMVLVSGIFEKMSGGKYEDPTDATPNSLAWGSRNIGMVIPLIAAMALNDKQVYMVAWLTQLFRDVPDTVSGFAMNGCKLMYIAFAGLVAVDAVCFIWSAA